MAVHKAKHIQHTELRRLFEVYCSVVVVSKRLTMIFSLENLDFSKNAGFLTYWHWLNIDAYNYTKLTTSLSPMIIYSTADRCLQLHLVQWLCMALPIDAYNFT